MKQPLYLIVILGLCCSGFLSSCQPAPSQPAAPSTARALVVETFLADIARQVAGDRMTIESLIPIGLDPHAFEPTPQDIARVSDSTILVVNGAGFEEWLQRVLDNAGGKRLVIEASSGLEKRKVGKEEVLDEEEDPHFWLNPLLVVRYAENIRDGFIQVDPQGKEIYTQNADRYIGELKSLDLWIQEQVKTIPEERRLLVTNHESLGYFADHYGFHVVGAIIPAVSTGASPSAQQLAGLIDRIQSSRAPAIFLESGSSPQLADQISQETGVRVVTDLYTHSITSPDGKAPSYIEMMKYNTLLIVEALK